MAAKQNNNIKGNYYIRVRQSGNWFVWYQHSVDGIRHQEPIADLAKRELGFKDEWSIEKAKAHCKQINKERTLLKEKVRLSAKRVADLQSIDETLFPQARITEFQELLEEENFGSDTHLRKLNSHFLFVQRMCNTLIIQPVEYKDSTKQIYKYFIKQKISTNYSFRIITLLNRWGRFISKINGSFYENVPAPRGRELSAIADAQRTKQGVETELGVRTESLPLTPEKLVTLQSKFSELHFNWLKISVWFGLRPEEVQILRNKKHYRIEHNKKLNITILHIYQTKLQSIAAAERWKSIPVILKEQKECLEIIENGNFKKPIYKLVRKHIGDGISLMGGRKGFVDLMLSLGQTIENISVWLGHKDLATTWGEYKDRKNVKWTPISEPHLKLVK